MKKLFLFFIISVVTGGLAHAQGLLTFKIYNTSSCGASNTSTVLPALYQFPATSLGAESVVEIAPTNTSSSTVKLITAAVSDTQDFSVTNFYVDGQIAPGATGPAFCVHFVPQQTGTLTTSMTLTYCLPNASGSCPGTSSLTMGVATFEGNATPAQILLTCVGPPAQCNGNPIQPASTLNIGNVPDGSTASVTFTLTNHSQSALDPQNLVSLQTAQFNTTPFALDTSKLPASLASGASATFTVSFSPGQAVLYQATLVVNASSFPLQGTGTASALGDLSSLVITYTDATGVRLTAQGGTPINFGQIVAGTSGSAKLTFAVCNPQTTLNPVTISTISISGSAFALSGLPSLPVTIPPAATQPCVPGTAGSISFQVVFSASAAGTYGGTLTIGSLQFALTGQSVVAPLPAMSFQLSQQPLTSQQQVNLTIQLASPSPIPAVGTLTMAFVPSVQNVKDDPAIQFLATNGRQLNVSVATGSQTATYNGQSAIAFQTGTTAGTITFTLQFTDVPPITQSFTILPEKIQITSASAIASSPNIVITINGFDNTYSAGQLSFTFYDTKGNAITPGAITVNAASQFQQYFFSNNNQAGGAFGLQATFPVYGGDVSQIGSVSVTLNNSAGSTSTTQTLQ
jgi:hypothetical protein